MSQSALRSLFLSLSCLVVGDGAVGLLRVGPCTFSSVGRDLAIGLRRSDAEAGSCGTTRSLCRPPSSFPRTPAASGGRRDRLMDEEFGTAAVACRLAVSRARHRAVRGDPRVVARPASRSSSPAERRCGRSRLEDVDAALLQVRDHAQIVRVALAGGQGYRLFQALNTSMLPGRRAPRSEHVGGLIAAAN